MKTTIANLIVVSALSFSGAALAAAETEGKVQPPATPASAVPPSAEPAPPATAQKSLPAPKASAPARAKPPRPKNLDLRHCLNLETDAEIAKCAGE
jgi:hypothetical protein